MFFNTQQNTDAEKQLIVKFIRVLDEMQDYLDGYDEIFGLAFDSNQPEECAEKLINFFTGRYMELLKK